MREKGNAQSKHLAAGNGDSSKKHRRALIGLVVSLWILSGFLSTNRNDERFSLWKLTSDHLLEFTNTSVMAMPYWGHVLR